MIIHKIKSVTKKEGIGWAYEDRQIGNELLLNFTQGKGGRGFAERLKFGEVIMLFQSASKIEGVQKAIYFTHIVKVVDNDVKDNKANDANYPHSRLTKVLLRPEFLDSIPKPLFISLANRGFGGTHDVERIETNNGKSTDSIPYSDLSSLILDLFLNFTDDLEYSKLEGYRKLEYHLWREITYRHVGVAQDYYDKRVRQGKVSCDVCATDFRKIYGNHGADFLEIHHRTFISKGTRNTKPTDEDFAGLCSNCHSMIHRPKFDKSYYTVEGLRDLVDGLRN